MRRGALALVSLIALAIATVSAQLHPRTDTVIERASLRYAEWLGPLEQAADAAVVVEAPLFDSPGAMTIDSQVATRLADRWLARVQDDEWRAGAAWYLQSRVVTETFDLSFHRPGYRYDWVCFFNCKVPWSFESLPLSRWTAAPPGMARAFTTLERELGWPTLQGALYAAAHSDQHPIGAMSDAVGRDLSGLFAAARSGAVIDPRIASFESIAGSCASPCYRTQVFLEEKGPVPLPLTLRVRFADGRLIDSRWNGGRDRFEFESVSPAVAASLDPERVSQLDRNPFNNASVEPRRTNVPVVKWVARWITWLQDAMLTQTFPV